MKKALDASTLSLTNPVWIVGTYDPDGKPNAMAAAWGGICCSKPPCVYVSLRKATYTYGSIVQRQAYTISVPSEVHVKEADYFGIASGRDVDKFARSGLTPVKSDLVDAPYVEEFPLVLECKVVHTIELGLHTQFIGEIVGVKADEDVLGEGDQVEIGRAKPFVFDSAVRAYYGIGRLLGKGFSLGKGLT